MNVEGHREYINGETEPIKVVKILTNGDHWTIYIETKQVCYPSVVYLNNGDTSSITYLANSKCPKCECGESIQLGLTLNKNVNCKYNFPK